jgi:integrase
VREAEDWVAQLKAATARGEHLDPSVGRGPFGEIAAAWLASNPNKRPTTCARDDAVIRTHLLPVIGDVRIGKLRPSPCCGVRLPEVRSSGKPVAGADDVRRLLDEIDPEYRAATHLGVMGLRLAEVVGLRVDSIDFRRRTLTVRDTINEVEGRFVDGTGKTGVAHRTISVPQSLLNELVEQPLQRSRRGGAWRWSDSGDQLPPPRVQLVSRV